MNSETTLRPQNVFSEVSDILICEDHPLVQKGLELSLKELLPGVKSLRQTQWGQQAYQMALNQKPDLVFVDLGLPDISGVELIRLLRQSWSDLKIIVLTNCDNPATLFQVKSLGVCGIMQKVSSVDQLQKMLSLVYEANSLITVLDTATEGLLGRHNNIDFTPREYEVLQEIICGKSNQEIADLLGCAVTTVRFHRANILEKTGIRNAAELTAWFFQGQPKRN